MSVNWAEVSSKHLTYLRKEVIPMWESVSPDKEYGGYFTCIDGNHKVYDTDKFIWLQGREAYMFAKLANELPDATPEERSRWIELSKLGVEFLRDKCRDTTTERKDFYFSVARDGTPQVAPFSIFSDCFACTAFAQYAKATGETWAKELAWDRFLRIEERRSNPVGSWGKGIAGQSREFLPLNVSMIDVNTCVELLSTGLFDGAGDGPLKARIQMSVMIMLEIHFDEKLGVFRENVPTPGERNANAVDTHEGRLVNPGHTLEGCWFILDTLRFQYDPIHPNQPSQPDVVAKVCNIIKRTLQHGWDSEFGGLFYFLDAEGKPLQQLEWDQKLWWVHQEALLACLYAFRATKDPFFEEWFVKIETYIFDKFVDKKNGGDIWGYLSREGRVLLNLKGGKWKGFFHSPRAFLLTGLVAKELAASS